MRTALPNRECQVTIDNSLGLLGRLVAIHPTIIIEHYSNYLDLEDIDSCILRSAIYWELNKSKVSSSRKTRVTKDSVMNPNPLHLDRPFTWIFTAKCGENSLRRWNAIPDPEFGVDVLTPATRDRLSKLNEQQLDELTAKIFNWQDASEMIAWLDKFND